MWRYGALVCINAVERNSQRIFGLDLSAHGCGIFSREVTVRESTGGVL
jgi:hypothetical protein